MDGLCGVLFVAPRVMSGSNALKRTSASSVGLKGTSRLSAPNENNSIEKNGDSFSSNYFSSNSLWGYK
jgi:hypothetical protein